MQRWVRSVAGGEHSIINVIFATPVAHDTDSLL